MTILEFVLLLIIAAITGTIGQSIAGFYVGGCLVSSAVGFIGALLGAWMSTQLGLPEWFVVNIGGQPFPILWSILGSAVFVAVISLVTRRRRPTV